MKRKIKYILAGLLGLIGLVSIGGKVVNAEEAGADNTGETSDATTVTMTREYYYDFKTNYTTKQNSIDVLDKNYSNRKLSIATNNCDNNKNKGIKLGDKNADKNSKYYISFYMKGSWTISIDWCLNSSNIEGGISLSGALVDDTTFTSTTIKTISGTTEGDLKLLNKYNSNIAYISSITITILENTKISQTSYTQDGSKDVDGYTTRFARFITTVNNASELNDLADAKYQVVYNNLTYNVNAYVCDALYDGEKVYTTDGITFNAQDDVKYIICTIAYDYKYNGETQKYSGDLTFNIILNGVTIATKTTTLA